MFTVHYDFDVPLPDPPMASCYYMAAGAVIHFFCVADGCVNPIPVERESRTVWCPMHEREVEKPKRRKASVEYWRSMIDSTRAKEAAVASANTIFTSTQTSSPSWPVAPQLTEIQQELAEIKKMLHAVVRDLGLNH
jgi:hypothetical protein